MTHYFECLLSLKTDGSNFGNPVAEEFSGFNLGGDNVVVVLEVFLFIPRFIFVTGTDVIVFEVFVWFPRPSFIFEIGNVNNEVFLLLPMSFLDLGRESVVLFELFVWLLVLIIVWLPILIELSVLLYVIIIV